MSRLRNFPKEISVGMKADSEMVLLPEKVDWELAATIKKVQKYSFATKNPDVAKQPRKRRKKTAVKSESSPEDITLSKEAEVVANFHCTACDRDVVNPKSVEGGEAQCPHCLKIGTIEGKE